MVHSTLLGSKSLKCIAIDGRNGGEGDCEPPLSPPVGVPKPSKYGVGLRKRKGVRYPHGRRPQLVNYTVNKSS